MKILIAATLFIGLTSGSVSLYGQVRLPALVADSMILQRDTKLKIWGWASAGEKVSVSFNGKRYTTKAGSDGKWLVIMSPVKAGGPYTMDISASNSIRLKSILAGDVWLCAGQSNMVHNLDRHKERYAEEISRANYSAIRQFIVPTRSELSGPVADLAGGKWKAATAKDILNFSVVAYFFALKIHEQYNIPVGLINASVGGTPVEAWTSEQGLKAFPGISATIQQNKDTARINQLNRLVADYNRKNFQKKPEDKGLTEPVKWYDTTYQLKNWKTINIPGYWEDQGVRNLNGVVWYRRTIDLPASAEGKAARLYMGRIVDADFVYANGVVIGNTTYQYPQRRYQVPAGVLKAGKNTIVVRVINQNGKGGFVPDKPYYLAIGDQTVDLKGYWQYKVGEVFKRDPDRPVGVSVQNQPTTLFNGMIAPLTNYAIKGMMWYQGETNAGNPEAYDELLPALIADWRSQWKQGDVPFVYAQLPNFMEVNYSPEESQWARLREAQFKALQVPNTAMAVTIDLGEWNDIHPGNKKPVGERLALAARKIAYGEEKLVASGPLYQSAQVKDNAVVIHFTSTGSGLMSIDGEPLHHFAIAGADKKFVWGDAVIEGNTVVVSSDKIEKPVYVRYAWADNPDSANLYNKEGLPASPFRTDP